ncbi:MAG: histidinol-phosphate transaminase [Micromonosporaceae bacterium]
MSAPTQLRLRSLLDQLTAYRPPAVPVAADGSTSRLAANESPYPPLPAVQAAIAEAAANANRYPDHDCVALTSAIAARLNVPPDHIVVGAGSAGVLQSLITAVAEPGTEVVYGWRSFDAYPVLARWSGAVAVPVPLRDATFDLPAMSARVGSLTRLVLVCNPNNPTGTVVSRGALANLLDRVPPDCLVVLDEAYHEFAGDQTADGIELHHRYPNVVVLRTFSKAHALAGLRVGYLVAGEPVAAAVRKTQLPFAVGHIAQAAALAALRVQGEVDRLVGLVVAERDRVERALRRAGYDVPGSHGNFIWLPLGPGSARFVSACAEAGVAVHRVGDDGVRVSIGTPLENDRFLAVAHYQRGEQ